MLHIGTIIQVNIFAPVYEKNAIINYTPAIIFQPTFLFQRAHKRKNLKA